MYERFTDSARKVMQQANTEASRLNHGYLGVEHILFGLLRLKDCEALRILCYLQGDCEKVRAALEAMIQPGPNIVTMGHRPQTPRVRKVIELAMEEARNMHLDYVGTEHLLVGVVWEGESCAAVALAEQAGVTLELVREAVRLLVGGQLPAPCYVDENPFVMMERELAAGRHPYAMVSIHGPGTVVLAGLDLQRHPVFKDYSRGVVREIVGDYVVLDLDGEDFIKSDLHYLVPRHDLRFVMPAKPDED